MKSALLRRAGIYFAAYLPSRRILARKYIGDNVLSLKHPTTGRRMRSIIMISAAVVHLNVRGKFRGGQQGCVKVPYTVNYKK